MRRVVAAAVIAAAATVALAQEPRSPEECLLQAREGSVVTVAHAGTTYRLASEACRAEFLTDPERYSQLYDALIEMAAEGAPVLAPARASLVPS